MSLKRIVEESDTPAGRMFDLGVQAAIVISLVAFTAETVPDLPPGVYAALHVVEIVSVLLFSAEYLLRLAVADRPLGYALSFFGLIDLAAVLPFYLTTGLDLRSLRLVRLLRLFRAAKLVRYTVAIDRLWTAIKSIRTELTVYLLASAGTLYLASVGIWYFEGDVQPHHFGSVPACMWWAMVTLTTVGYGDVYPVTVGGKLFTSVVLIIGLGVVAVPTGLMASALTVIGPKQRAGNDETPA